MENVNNVNKAIADYYANHREDIVIFIAKRLGNLSKAEDLSQDVFLKLLTSKKMITTQTLPNLAYTIARNLLYDYWRHHKMVDEYEQSLNYSYYGDGLDVASVFSINEVTEILEKGIAMLNDNQRTIYRMNVYDGLQVSEISIKLGEKYKYIENKLGTARKISCRVP
jgi:RNA polymerase sigma factor (sigma-70 family)